MKKWGLHLSSLCLGSPRSLKSKKASECRISRKLPKDRDQLNYSETCQKYKRRYCLVEDLRGKVRNSL